MSRSLNSSVPKPLADLELAVLPNLMTYTSTHCRTFIAITRHGINHVVDFGQSPVGADECRSPWLWPNVYSPLNGAASLFGTSCYVTPFYEAAVVIPFFTNPQIIELKSTQG